LPRKPSLDKAVLPFIDTCTNLTNDEKELLRLTVEGEQEPWEKLGIARSTYYYRLRKAYKKLQQCLAGEIPSEEPREEKPSRKRKEEKKEESKEVKVRTRTDPDRTAVQQSLKVLASTVGKRSAEQMKEILEVGILFYDKFRYVKEILGIPWDMLVEILYKVYIEHRDEIEIPYLELFEKELLKRIAEAIEEIET